MPKSINLRIEIILSVVSYERKNIIVYEKNVKLSNNNTFNNVFCNIILIYSFLYSLNLNQ